MKRLSRKTVLLGAAALAIAAGLAAVWWPDPGPRYHGQSLRHWLTALANDDYRVRLPAEAALRNIGPEAVPELTRALRAEDSRLREWWWRLRRRFWPQTAAPLRAEDLAAAAAGELARLGPPAAPAAPALARRIWIEPAAQALRGIGPPAIPAIAAALADPDPRTLNGVASLLSDDADKAFGPALTNLIPPLLGMLSHPDVHQRENVLRALPAVGRDNARVVTAVAARLSSPVATERGLAAKALAALGPAARAAVPDLLVLAKSDRPAERLEAARALRQLGVETNTTVAVLCELLDAPECRWEAAATLGEMGPAASAAVPRLLIMLETDQSHRPSRTPSMAALALGKLGPAAVPGLVPLLTNVDSDVRVNAAVALTGLGAAGAPAVPGLAGMLRAEDPEEQLTAANALAAIGPEAAAAVPELTRLAQISTIQDVVVGHARSAARDALERIRGPAAASAAAIQDGN